MKATTSALAIMVGRSYETDSPQEFFDVIRVSNAPKWIEFEVTYENVGKTSVWISGLSPEDVRYELETRIDANHKWTAYGMLYFGSPVSRPEVKPGAKGNFKAALPAAHRGKEFRVILNYYMSRKGAKWKQARSVPRKLAVQLDEANGLSEERQG